MSAVYAFFIAVYVYGEIGLKDVPRVLLRSANLSAMLLYIITNAVLFSFVLANENIPNALADWMLALNLGWVGFLLLVNLLLLIAGNFMEPSLDHPDHGADPVPDRDAARHRSGAFRHPDRRQHGGRPLPPAGRPQPLRRLGIIARCGITELTKAVMPWLLTMLVFLVIVTYWPGLTLVVPRAWDAL